MRELVIISGKGGTGKTSIVASFAALAESKVMVDCDVDAADLHLVLNPEVLSKTDFYVGKEAEIDSDKCIQCGKCIELCKFDAITDKFEVKETKCEGCGVCYHFCPVDAIKFEDKKSGEWFESKTRFGKLVHAKLGIAEENSGKLVTTIRNHARLVAHRENLDKIIVDGSPGIGCPVIASISGAHLVVIVTEPTLSGLHDMQRVFDLTKHFKIPSCVLINKFDINEEVSGKIEEFCNEKEIELIGKVKYTKDFTAAQIQKKTFVEAFDNDITDELKSIWNKVEKKLENKEERN